MKSLSSSILIASILIAIAFPVRGQEASAPEANSTLPAQTSIDRYVQRPDDSFRWKVVRSGESEGVQTFVIDMVSQSWRSADEVNRTEWQHWITCAVPQQLKSETGFLMIGGGSNRNPEPPEGPDGEIVSIAKQTGTVVCELKMVPNQPLIFHNDGQPRVEDDLIGYTWDQYLKTGDADWLARNAMVKSAVRAMDAITAFMASKAGGERNVNQYVIAGGSKRGWTTWLTGAMDPRVVGIVPIVIDVLNTEQSMRHHFAAYGYWAPAIGNYVEHRIMERMAEPRLRAAYQLVDPYYYRHRLTMPKFIVNAAGDEFFLPDSSQFYWDDLQGPKYLRYVPNADHGLDDSDALESIIAFYGLLLADQEPPSFDWTEEVDGSFKVHVDDPPQEVRLWHATNPTTRDFRLETLGPKYVSETIRSDDGQTYMANVPVPEQGWTAYFVELTYDVGLPVPLKLTTNVRVVPDILPYADKQPNLPSSVTIVCQADSAESAGAFTAAVKQLVSSGKLPVVDLLTKTDKTTCYVNFRPGKLGRKAVTGLTDFAKQQGCQLLRYQLESGSGITP